MFQVPALIQVLLLGGIKHTTISLRHLLVPLYNTIITSLQVLALKDPLQLPKFRRTLALVLVEIAGQHKRNLLGKGAPKSVVPIHVVEGSQKNCERVTQNEVCHGKEQL